MKNSLLRKGIGKIAFLLLVAFIGLNVSNKVFAQTRNLNIPEVQYTTMEDYYRAGNEITCTARVYSNGLIDQICAIYYTIYKDDFDTPITSVGNYGNISYTIRSQGTSYMTQAITTGSGYLGVKPLWTIYKAFTLGIFDNYCVNRNRPLALSMTFNEPGVYKFNAEIHACTNSGLELSGSGYTANGALGCGTDSHGDKVASTCDNPTILFADAIYITICEDNFISFSSGSTEFCPGEEINLVYNIGEYDDKVDMSLLPSWMIPIIDPNTNTLILTGNAPEYDSENPIINFDVRIQSILNPTDCPGATISQFITIKDAQAPIISGDNLICEPGGTVTLTSNIATTWSSSNTEIATIHQTAPDSEVVVSAQNIGTTIITCQENSSECNLISNEFVFTVNENSETTLTETICEGDSHIIGENELGEAGEYTINLISQLGCDSTVILTLQVNELSSTEFYIEDESYTWNGIEYTESGDYIQTFPNVNACDSIVTLHFAFVCNECFVQFLSGLTEYCPGEEINLVYNIADYNDSVDVALLPDWINPIIDQNENTLTLTGNAPAYDAENPTINFDVRVLLTTSSANCPGAIINQIITIKNAQLPTISGDNMLCEGGSLILVSNMATTWMSSNNGVGTIEQTAPDSEVIIIAQNPGTTIITCQENISDCNLVSDEFVLTVNENYETALTESICEGAFYLIGEEELSIAGEYSLILTSQSGCDSTVVLTLQVNELSSTQFYIEDESYIWNGIEYTESGDYVQTFPNVNACDSIVTLHLTIVSDVESFLIAKETINVYPNPVSESLHVDITKENAAYSIILIDVMGKLLIKKDHASVNNILDVSHISAGAYFIGIFVENKIIYVSMIHKE